jgi:hypothetical protein
MVIYFRVISFAIASVSFEGAMNSISRVRRLKFNRPREAFPSCNIPFHPKFRIAVYNTVTQNLLILSPAFMVQWFTCAMI